MCAPHEFRVGSPINPWMQSASPVDPALVSTQWQQLADTYVALGVDVVTVDPEAGLSDALPLAGSGRARCVRSGHRLGGAARPGLSVTDEHGPSLGLGERVE